MEHVVKRAYSQILTLFSANMVKALFGFLGTIFVLRNWSTSDIGDIYTLVGVLLLFQKFGDLGTGSSFIQLYSRTQKESVPIIETYLGFKLLVFFLLFGFFLLTAGYSFFVEASREVMGLSAVTLAAILSIYGGFFTVFITAKQEFNKLSIYRIAPPLVKTLVIVAFCYLGCTNFPSLLFAFLLPSAILFVLGYFTAGVPLFKHALKLKPVFTRRGGQLYQMSKWIFLFDFAQVWFSQIDIFMLKRMSNDEQIALFVSASRLAAIVLMFSQAIFTVMLPKMRSFKRDEELLDLSLKFLKLYVVFMLLMIPIIYIAPYIVTLVLGERYINSIPILQVFIFQTLGHMFISSQSLIFFRKNLLRQLVLFAVVQLALNFVGNYLVIYDYKALGAVWVSTVLNHLFYYFIFVYSYIYLKKTLVQQDE